VSQRTPEASAVETTHLVLPPDTNAHGTAFGGRVMEWMDVTASIAAIRHCRLPVVTANVDDLTFERPIRLGDVVIVRSKVNFTGRTSMEIGIRVEREIPQVGRREHCLSGYFTFVAMGPDGAPAQVPPIEPQTDEDRRRFKDAEARRAVRLERRARKSKGSV
jgi:acyl-CoA hydrolase